MYRLMITMVLPRRYKPHSCRSDPVVAGCSLCLLVFSLFLIIFVELSTEKLTIEQLVVKEEALVKAKFSQLRRRRSWQEREEEEDRIHHIQEDAADAVPGQEPITVEEAIDFLYKWVRKLHKELIKEENLKSAETMWKVYHDLTHRELVPWDQDYLGRMPPPRQDDSIFLSIATYRDENCPNTLRWAYGNATNPERLYVGLVQQNCYENCRSGVMEGGGTREIPPDDDCHQVFCEDHPQYCSQIRPLKLQEIESLGPYGARFLASKLYGGEQWYMQMDAHMTFLPQWDEITVKSLHLAPSKKPVVSHYPPGHNMDLINHWGWRPAGRLCGPVFSTPDGGMIRLEGLKKWDKIKIDIPRFAPFAAAGFLIGTALLLKEVPFDPYLPWIFMGEEIIMSTRLWTSGYDLFSPAQAVVGHIYVRSHKPKFWETMHRFFRTAGHDDIDTMVLLRIKNQLGYPEAARDYITNPTILDDLEHYSMGHERKLKDYMQYAGIDVMRKEVFLTHYCEEHLMPPGKEHLAKLYVEAETESRKNATLVEKGK